ncbi:MAG TPA: beta-ketoacyl-ACP synthase II [Planctomycetota bacterium]|nr:beta-ketoacyl-ACP synthase II [Planctomycetota bacterium]
MRDRRRVVITGLGVASALGFNIPEFWEALLSCRSGICGITSFDASDYPCRIAGEIRGFDGEKFLDPKVCKRLDRFSQFALVAAAGAVDMSDIDFARENPERCGVIIGSGIGGLLEIEEQHKRLLEKGPRRVSPMMIPKLMINAASAQISIVYQFRGPNTSTVTACASSAHAIADAANIIRRSEADVMISGGAEACITPLSLAGFCAQKALARNFNDDPQHASRPFDVDRDGFVMAEGAGVLVIEELEHAKARGARIYAEFLGSGSSGDAYNIVAPQPDGQGAIGSIRRALESARLNPDDIDYVNAHGTSTPLGDEMEAIAIRTVFGDRTDRIPVSATKSVTGHLLGASAGLEAVATVMILDTGVIHPTANCDHPDPRCRIDCVPNEPREADVRLAVSNSFGFGGHNATLAFGKFTG